MKAEVTWLKFGLRLLSFIETILPAVLIAQNGRLRNQIKKLEAEIALAKFQFRQEQIKRETEAKYANKNDRDVIDDILHDSSSG